MRLTEDELSSVARLQVNADFQNFMGYLRRWKAESEESLLVAEKRRPIFALQERVSLLKRVLEVSETANETLKARVRIPD